MNRLEKLYQLTKQLMEVFDQEITSKNRDVIIKEIDQLIEQRGRYLKEVTPPYSKIETITGKEIVHMNKKIEKEMNVLFNGLKKEMQQIKKQKRSNQSYVDPYKNLQTIDGMFMDSKS